MAYIQNFQVWNKDEDTKNIYIYIYTMKPASLEWKASGMTVQCFTSCPPDHQLNRTFLQMFCF